MVDIAANPIAVRAALVLLAAGGAFGLAIWLIRSLRKKIATEGDIGASTAPTLEGLPLHLYNTVIQQLKQQKHELQVQNQAEQRRSRTTENFSQAVLSNLSCGVLVFDANGLVKQANRAAKEILGFNSPSGMNAQDIFRGAGVSSAASAKYSAAGKLSEEVQAVLREGSKSRQTEADYTTPVGKKVRIAVVVSPVPAADGSLLGAACLINDRSEFTRILEQQQLQSEISVDMALDLRTSLNTIEGYAKQLGRNRDPEMSSRLADDIAAEAARLDQHIGGFLAACRPRQAASASKG